MEQEEFDGLEVLTPDGTPVRQIAVFLPNRPGAFVSILDLMKANQVVVLGLSVQDSIDNTVVRLVVNDPDTVQTVFIEKGIPFNTTDLVVVELNEGPEQMPDCLRTMLTAETNIHFIYPLITKPRGRPALALCVEDNDFGRTVLAKAGYKVLVQEDLSR